MYYPRFLPRRGSSTWPPMRSYPFARGPLRRPDVIAPPMEADRTPLRQVAFDFHIVGRDGLLTRHADAAGSGAVPGHAAVLFRRLPASIIWRIPSRRSSGLPMSVCSLWVLPSSYPRPRGDLPQSRDARVTRCHEHIRLEPHQLSGEIGRPVILERGEAALDLEIPPLHVPRPLGPESMAALRSRTTLKCEPVARRVLKRFSSPSPARPVDSAAASPRARRARRSLDRFG